MTLLRAGSRRCLSLVFVGIITTAVFLLAATAAQAGLDNWPTGNGQDGAFNDPGTNGALNYSAPITSASGSTITTGVGRAGSFGPGQTDFKAGRLVMVIQSSGYPSGSAISGDQGVIDLSNNAVGRFEIARVNTISGSISGGYTLNLTQPLDYSYSASGSQVVAIPEFTSFTIAPGRSIGANPWDGSNGGITAFLATGSVTLGSGASINANGSGFRGGAVENHGTAKYCTQLDGGNAGRKGEGIVLGAFGAGFKAMGNRANGAGGGNCENAGGGGGGNGGYGGYGGKSYDSAIAQYAVGGRGGQRLIYSPLDHAVFGGGGGSGDANNNNAGAGSPGGGVVFIRGAILSAAGATISANGLKGGNSQPVGPSDGAGGGGAGGVVHARFTSSATCAAISARGGDGGTEQSTGANHGPGGGGGGGRVYFQSGGGACSTSAAGGARGLTSVTNDPRDAGPGPNEIDLSGGASEQPSGGLIQPTAAMNVPVAGSTVSPSPVFSGTATPISTIRVYIDGTFRGTTISDGAGNWVYNAPTLAGGSHTAYVIPVKFSIAGEPSATRSFVVDATAPAAPVITSPAGNIATNNSKPTVSGTAEALSTITLFDGNTPIGSGTTGAGGSWSVVPNSPLSLGPHTITARATDPYGNQSPLSASRTITFNDVLPTVTINSPSPGAYLSSTTPVFSFSASVPGTATCQIDSGAQASCASPWTAPVTSQGRHSITVRWTDSAGNTGSASQDFVVDTILPTVTIISPASNGAFVGSPQPSIGFTVSDANEAIASQCRVDSGSFTTCQTPWVTPSLNPGSHTVQVRHTDLAGNVRTESRTFTVDTSPPSVAINTPANNGYAGSSNPKLEFTVLDASAGTSYCKIDDSPETTCANGDNWGTALADGQYTLAIRHVDAAGNEGSTASSTFIVDTIAPAVSIQSPTPSQLVRTNAPQIEFSIDDLNPASTSSCRIDDAAPNPCVAPYAAVGLSQGQHTITVIHSDRAGNSSSAAVPFIVDSQVPAPATFTSAPNDPTNKSEANFAFTAAEPGGRLECQLDGAAWTTCQSPRSFTGLSVGAHTFLVRQIDVADNIGEIASYNWFIDKTPPPAPVVSGPSGISGSPTETFTFYSAEQGVSFKCSFDSAPPVACGSPYTVGPLSNGPHSFSVTSTDPAGNQSSPTELGWTTDIGKFSVVITSSPSGLSATRSGSFFFDVTVEGATFYCSLDGAAPEVCNSPFNYAGLSDGQHSFSLYAKKDVQQTPTVSRTWKIDATPPSLSVSNPSNGGTTGGSPTVNYTAGDSAGSFVVTCKLDNAPPVPCPSGYRLDNLPSGSHTLIVAATDLAGNVTSVVRTWNVDTSAPDTSLTLKPDASTRVALAEFGFASSKPASTFECSLDGGPWVGCSSTRQVSVGEGAHTFSVRATDSIGNVDPTPARFTWVRDVTAPATPTITSDARVLIATSTFMFTGRAEGRSNVELYFDGARRGIAAASADGNWFRDFTNFENGTYVVRARSVDAAGNVSEWSNPVTLTIDTDSPRVEIASPGDGTTVNSPNVEFTGSDTTSTVRYECGVQDLTNGAGSLSFGVCAPPLYLPDLISGHTYRLTVRAVDALENYATDVVTFTFDDTPPARPTISTPARDGDSNTTPVAIGGSAESGAEVSIYVDGLLWPESVTATGGTWSYIFNPDLPERSEPYKIRVVAIDRAGNQSQPSATRTITIDRSPPSRPTITSPVDGRGINNPKPAIRGNAEPGSTIVLTIDGKTANVVVGPEGTWSYTPSSPLGTGPHSISAESLDAAGNRSEPSNTVTVTVDAQPPVVAISSPVDGAVLDQSSVLASFTASDDGSFMLICSLDGAIITPCEAPETGLNDLSESKPGDEPHVFSIEAVDEGGNVASASVRFRVDTTAPAPPVITEPADGGYVSGSQILVSGTAEAGANIDLALSNGATATTKADQSGNWSRIFGGLSDGPYSLSALARDDGGNTSGTVISSFTVDNAKPSAPVISQPVGGSQLQSLSSVSGGGAEPGALVTVAVGGQSDTVFADGVGNWLLELESVFTEEGQTSITAFQMDSAGNVSDNRTVSIRIDRTAPSIAISAPLDDAQLNTNAAQIYFTATDASNSVVTTCRISTGSFAPCSSPWSTPALEEGSNTVYIRATDGAGNQATKSVTFTVDTIPPVAQFTGTLPGQSTSGQVDKSTSPSFSFTSNEQGSTFRCNIDNGAWSACTSPRATEALSNGPHTFRVKAVDRAGNESSSATTWTWTVDSIAPNKPRITAPSDGANLSDSKPVISGTAEPLSVVSVRVDGSLVGTAQTGANGSWSLTPSSPIADEGIHLLTASAADEAGNVSPSSNSVQITIVEPGDPVASFTAKPSAMSNDAAPTFSFGATKKATYLCKHDVGDEEGSWIDCAEDGGPAKSGFYTLESLSSQGKHRFTVIATDLSGNVSAPVSWEWKFDSIAPEKPLIESPAASNPAALLADATPRISGTAEAGSTVEIYLGVNKIGSVVASAGGAWQIDSPPLSDGAYTAKAHAIDSAGNKGLDSDPVPFFVDTKAPAGQIVQQPGSGTNGAKPVFLISSDDPLATFACSIDSGPVVACTSPYTPANDLAPGTHTIRVTLTDRAGNSNLRTLVFTATSPPPPDSGIDLVPAACFPGGIAITDLSVSSGSVKLSGFASPSNAGKKVAIFRQGSKKRVGTAKVSADGSFKTNIKIGDKKLLSSTKTSFRAVLGGGATRWTQLLRRMATTTARYSGGTLSVKGAVRTPLSSKSSKITVSASASCAGPWAPNGSTGIRKSGSFSVKLPFAPASKVVFVKVSAVVGDPNNQARKIKTSSFVIPVIIR